MFASPDLFAPISLGDLELPNRIAMAPMTRSRAGEGSAPTALTVQYYVQRASAGLIISEGSQVSPQGVGYPDTPGIHTEAQIAAWRKVTDAVHAAGGRIFLQLWHVGRVSHPYIQPDNALPVAPSAVGFEGKLYTFKGMVPYETPRALETDEIPGVVEQFVQGARNAKAAGFDGVELHGANGYLIEQFLLDGVNLRTDRYGGSVENRARFLLEVTEGVIGVWSDDRVGVRLSPNNAGNGMVDSNRHAIYQHVGNALNAYKLAYLHVVERIDANAPQYPLTPMLRETYHGRLMVNGGYGFETGTAAITSRRADLVSYGVPFIANPDLVERFKQGAPLNTADRATFYGGTEKGYTDYPTLVVEAQN